MEMEGPMDDSRRHAEVSDGYKMATLGVRRDEINRDVSICVLVCETLLLRDPHTITHRS